MKTLTIHLKKKKNLTKAERNLRSRMRWMNILGMMYFIFVTSNVLYTALQKEWLFVGLHMFFLSMLMFVWVYLGNRYHQQEKELIDTKTELFNTLYDLDQYGDIEQLPLNAKASFLEHVCKEQNDKFTICTEALLEHYHQTK